MIIYDQDKLHIRDEFTLGQSKNKKLPHLGRINFMGFCVESQKL